MLSSTRAAAVVFTSQNAFYFVCFFHAFNKSAVARLRSENEFRLSLTKYSYENDWLDCCWPNERTFFFFFAVHISEHVLKLLIEQVASEALGAKKQNKENVDGNVVFARNSLCACIFSLSLCLRISKMDLQCSCHVSDIQQTHEIIFASNATTRETTAKTSSRRFYRCIRKPSWL